MEPAEPVEAHAPSDTQRPGATGPFARDDFPTAERPVRSIEGIQPYAVSQNGFTIHNGRHTFNRPLFGPPGPVLPFSGDRPQWMLAEIGRCKLGILSLAVNGCWLHEADDIESAYDAGRMMHTVRDPAFPGNALTVTTHRLPEGGGCIVRVQAEKPVAVHWIFGGVRAGFDTDWAGSGGFTPGLHPEDASGNQVQLRPGLAIVRAPQVLDRAAAIAASGSVLQEVALRDAEPAALFASPPGHHPGVGGVLHVGSTPSFLILTAVAGEQDVVPAPTPETFAQAEAAWRERVERLAAVTPDPELDAAVRSNNATLDGIWRPPSFLQGAVQGATKGWPLGWRGWYGPTCAGDHDRVRSAIRFHARHQIEQPATGIQSRGAFHFLVRFDGQAERGDCDRNQAFLDQLRHYAAWTGDLDTLRQVWPAVRRCLDYERREMDPDGDALYANQRNTWAFQTHLDRDAGCTLASASLHAAMRFAAQVAERLGEDPSPYRTEADRIRDAAQHHLWMERAGTFAETVDRDGVRHTAAAAASICRAVESRLADPLQAARAIDWLADHLWQPGDQVLVHRWFPVSEKTPSLAHTEALDVALACFRAGHSERGWRLLRSVVRAFHRAAVPGSLSCCAGPDGEQGACIDCADAASLFARCVVEGLFGLEPDLLAGCVSWSPRFPAEWPHATLRTAGYSLSYQRAGLCERYTLETPRDLAATLRLPLRFDRLKQVTLNGKAATYQGETSLGRQLIAIRSPAGRRVVVEVTYSHRSRFRVAPSAESVVSGDPVAVSTTAGTLAGVVDATGALRGVHTSGSRAEARAGNPGRHTLYVRVRLPHAEVLQPVSLHVRPTFELLAARLLADVAHPGTACLEVTLRCNRPERVPPPVEVFYAGRTYRGRLGAKRSGEKKRSAPPGDEHASGGASPAGWRADRARMPVEQTFRFAVENPERLSPGGMRVQVTVRTLAGPVVLEGETRLWSLLQAWPDALRRFSARCQPLHIPRNASLAMVVARARETLGESSPGRCAEPDVDPLAWNPLRQCLQDGVFLTEVGVPFRIPDEGANVLCLAREPPYPREVEIPVDRQAEKVYLLLANATHESQTHLPQVRVRLHYADGDSESVDLWEPNQVDHLLQHYAARNYPQRLRDWPEGSGSAAGWSLHADVLDLLPSRRQPLARLRIECLRRHTLIGVLGITLL